MNVEQLKKIMKPTVKKGKTVFLVAYIENDDDSVTLTYKFKGQKESHLKIDVSVWNGMEFKKQDGNITITDLNGLKVYTNENGWSRLTAENEEDQDE